MTADGLRRAAYIVNSVSVIKRINTYQLLPEAPMTVMGEQVRPTLTFKSWRTMPRRLRIAATGLLVADSTLSQHWTGPVEQLLAGSSRGAGVATARVARAAETKASLNCMISVEGDT